MSFEKSTIWWLLILFAMGSYFYFFEVKTSVEKSEDERNIEMEALSMLSPEEINEKIDKKKEEGIFIKIFTFKEGAIESVEILRAGKIFSCRREDKAWEILKPIKGREEDGIIDSLISTVANLVEVRLIDDDPADLDEYGLKEPYAVIKMEIKGASSPTTIIMGNNNPNTTSVYAMIKGSPKVFLVGSLIKFELEATLNRFHAK